MVIYLTFFLGHDYGFTNMSPCKSDMCFPQVERSVIFTWLSNSMCPVRASTQGVYENHPCGLQIADMNRWLVGRNCLQEAYRSLHIYLLNQVFRCVKTAHVRTLRNYRKNANKILEQRSHRLLDPDKTLWWLRRQGT